MKLGKMSRKTVSDLRNTRSLQVLQRINGLLRTNVSRVLSAHLPSLYVCLSLRANDIDWIFITGCERTNLAIEFDMVEGV